MKTMTPLSEQLQRSFEPGGRGVVDLFADLLAICPQHGLQLDWQDNRCRLRRLDAGLNETTEVSIPKSAFRAILARVAALCNEQSPNSVSPYGGESDLTSNTDPSMNFRISFTNSPAEQWLRVMRVTV